MLTFAIPLERTGFYKEIIEKTGRKVQEASTELKRSRASILLMIESVKEQAKIYIVYIQRRV